jgi:hypothetical protein
LKKLYLPIAVLMIAILLGTAACSSAPSELKPAKVQLSYIINEWYGEETIVADSLFVFENPNPIPVLLDAFNYTIYLKDQPITQKTVGPGVMIPANSSISVTYANVLPFTGFGGVAFEGYYMAKSMEYVPAHIAGAAPWKLLGGKKPPLWTFAALGVLPTIKAGPAPADVAAGNADAVTAAAGVYAKARGTIDAVQGALDKAWDSYPAGPCEYKVVGKATISSPSLTKSMDTPFTFTYTRN